MDPTTLPGMPAPFWFVQFFKVVGFTLHMIPMGIWFAGLPVAIGCALWNCEHSRRFARRMFGQFPIFMALGINFGIVPLLFLQTTYYKSFYTATILTAWHWLAVIPILIVGYYSLYLAAFSRDELRSTAKRAWRMIGFGILASFCLVAIGMLITNGLTLMVRSDLWPGIMERTNHFGATTGLANNFRDPAVWIRLATMFSLGLMTTGVWAAFDAHFLMRPKEAGVSTPAPSNDLAPYRRWTLRLGWMIGVLGVLILGTIILLNLSKDSILNVTYPFCIFVFLISAIAVGCLLIKKPENARINVVFAAVLQFCSLGIFAIIRQIGQNAGVASYVDVTKIPTDVQWTPLIAFLVCFVLGLGVIAWMVKQCINIKEDSPATNGSG